MNEQYIKERPRDDSLLRWSLTSLETGRAIWANFVADDLLTSQFPDSVPPSVHVVHQFIRKAWAMLALRYVISNGFKSTRFCFGLVVMGSK